MYRLGEYPPPSDVLCEEKLLKEREREREREREKRRRRRRREKEENSVLFDLVLFSADTMKLN